MPTQILKICIRGAYTSYASAALQQQTPYTHAKRVCNIFPYAVSAIPGSWLHRPSRGAAGLGPCRGANGTIKWTTGLYK